MTINLYNKSFSYLAVTLNIINIFIYLFLAYNSYNLSLKQIVLLIGVIPSTLSIISIFYAGLGTPLPAKKLQYFHRIGLITIMALTFICFQFISNSIISNKGILGLVILFNIYCMIIIFINTFSKKANKYNETEFLKQTQNHLYNISKISVFCIIISSISAIISQFDIPHLIISLIFSLPLIITYYLKQAKRKKVYHIILLLILSLLLVYIGLVIFSNGVTPISFSFYFLSTLSLIVFHFLSLKHKNDFT